MVASDRPGSSAPAHLPRRTLIAAGAWTVPVVAAATAAPAYAASPCDPNQSYVMNWTSPQAANFNRTSATAASATAATTTSGQDVTIALVSAVIGNTTGSPGQTKNNYVLDPTWNLSVPGPSAGGTAPSVTNLGNIVPNGAERGLCLQHSASSTGTLSSSGVLSRGQQLTITFSRAVTDLTFWIVDIDSTVAGYWDRVRFTNAAPTVLHRDPAIDQASTGAGAAPFRYGTAQTDNNISENATGARVRVRFSGPITSLEMQYWNASNTTGDAANGLQRLFLGDFEFTASGC